jgi:hypothetical protein
MTTRPPPALWLELIRESPFSASLPRGQILFQHARHDSRARTCSAPPVIGGNSVSGVPTSVVVYRGNLFFKDGIRGRLPPHIFAQLRCPGDQLRLCFGKAVKM